MLARTLSAARACAARAATRNLVAPATQLYSTRCCIAAAAVQSRSSVSRSLPSWRRPFSSAASSVDPLAAATAAALAASPLRSMRYALAGQCALVTGGSSGIGFAIAQLLAEQGVQVAITSRSSKRALAAAADIDAAILQMDRHAAVKMVTAEVQAPLAAAAAATAAFPVPPPLAPPPRSAVLPVLGLECDVRSSVSVDTAVEAAWAAFGSRLDLVVHAAGVSHDALVARASDGAIEDTFQTNLVGATYLARAASRKMISRRPIKPADAAEETSAAAVSSSDAAAEPLLTAYPGGVLVFIGSIVGQHGSAGQAVYAASKSGLHGLTLSLSQELSSRAVRVHCVCPGFIDTAMTRALSPRALRAIRDRLPAGVAVGEASDVAHLVAFLASPAAKYMTGQIIAVDGGIRK